MNILFNEKLHKYYIENTDRVFTSVSKVLDTVKEKFASNDDELFEKAVEYFKKYKDNPKKPKKWDNSWQSGLDVFNGWKEKNRIITKRGTIYHALREEELIKDGAIIHNHTKNGEKVCFSMKELQNLKPGIYPELIIPNINTLTIGTADYIEIFEDKSFIIRDLKTNDDLEVEPVKFYNKDLGYKDYKYLHPPVEHIISTKFNVYQLQLSMYSLFLEKLGYKFKGGFIEHVIFNDQDEVIETRDYPIVYYRQECIAILNYFRAYHQSSIKV